jgi:hypothetical protein
MELHQCAATARTIRVGFKSTHLFFTGPTRGCFELTYEKKNNWTDAYDSKTAKN